MSFLYPPSPHILQWLAAGQLSNRLHRSVRLWLLLHKFYGSAPNWATELPKFTYSQLRDRLYVPSHSQSHHRTAEEVTTCRDSGCICHQSLLEIVFTSEIHQSETVWRDEVMHLTGLSAEELEEQLRQRPFATVHRSIRDDLKQLSQMGWLQVLAKGRYQCCVPQAWPTPPAQASRDRTCNISTAHLSFAQTWELLRVLETLAFVQPNLSLVVRSLWEQVTDIPPNSQSLGQEQEQRIFIHLDYILSEEMQEQVDTYQEQIEQLWHRPPGGVVHFDYWIAAEERKAKVTVYPVCLHYIRRAKYLSAYGIDPNGQMGWHNYRLDRIASRRLKVLPWGDPLVPKALKDLWHEGSLPTPEEIQTELAAAWGFNFYLKRELLILRFPPAFAHWYVDNTVRHPTFQPVKYQRLPQLIRKEIADPQERQQVLEIIKQQSSTDAYYQAWIRNGDINVIMRLRDWRPNGEVIAPLSLRRRLAQEAAQELTNYQENWV